MSAHRFYIPPSAWKRDHFTLDAAESHHALDVLRLETGQRVTIFNGEGAEAIAEIVKAGRDAVELHTIQTSATPPLACAITLAQAVPKGKNMELIIEKATELGAAAIAPLLSERTVVQCDEQGAARKQEKWRRVAIEASKQCGQNWLPSVLAPVSVKHFFDTGEKFDLMLIASLQPGAKASQNCPRRIRPIEAVQRAHSRGPGRRLHARGAGSRKKPRLPADHARSHHPAD